MQKNRMYKRHADTCTIILMTYRNWFKVSIKKKKKHCKNTLLCHDWLVACAKQLVSVHLRPSQRVSAHLSSTGRCTVQPHPHHLNTGAKSHLSLKQTVPRSRHNQLSWLSLANRTVCCPPLDTISTVRLSSCLPVIFTGLHSSVSSPVPSCMLVPIPQEYTEPGTNATMRKCGGETVTTLQELSAHFTGARYLEHVGRG